MVTISHITNKLIDDNFFLQEVIKIGIVNYTLLSKYLKPDVERIYGKKVNLSAITRALDRYTKKLDSSHKKFDFNFFKSIKLDSDVIYIVVQKSPNISDKLQKAYNEISMTKDGYLQYLLGSQEIGIITNKEYKDDILDILCDEKISHVENDHVSVSLTYSKDYSFESGILYGISRQIAWEKINVLTWLHTPTELTLIIHENHATRCYNILHKMLKNQKDDIEYPQQLKV